MASDFDPGVDTGYPANRIGEKTCRRAQQQARRRRGFAVCKTA
jgi:hypothetical protein